MDKRAIIAAGVILLIPIVMLGIWAFQGESMEDDFAMALRSGEVKALHLDLQGKQWSSDELATIEVIKVPGGFGRERALTRTVHSRGRIFVSKTMYEYQATIRDDDTDIVHVFGFRRSAPLHWSWERFHPDSMQIHLQRRTEQMEALKQRFESQQEP